MRRYRTRQRPVILFALGLAFLVSQPVWACHSGSVVAQRASLLPGSWAFSSLAVQTPAAQPQIQFERITAADGLSFPVVRDILQDRQGFIWFECDQ